MPTKRQQKKPETSEKISGVVQGLGPVLSYIVLPLAAVFIVYEVIVNFFTRGGDAFINLYKTQLDAYIKKMDGYAKTNNGVLNEAQRLSSKTESDLMGATAANAAQAYLQPVTYIAFIIGAAVTVWGIFYGADKYAGIRAKWNSVVNTPATKPKSPRGVKAITECLMVDALAIDGLPIVATNYLTTVQDLWNTVEIQQMQAEMFSLQTQIDAGLLSGFELAMAQSLIQSYTFDIALMPTIFALPLFEYRNR